ncbi:hybrid sensor histidine kinase/response regulator [Pseudomonas sp. LS44]|uniref:ATP-binding response regulator n=1 Tax=Pseudomonas sp. LS44 TaxID=1357074 RepID=UPI00215B4B01|nr:hybrid sensor histidine kinase/response regulator [Pseudomonas sp. LS44]UVE18068.1 hybrid sensor histidine kinase/response regulator [Pseudomonas sp. LS44]
MNEVALSDKLGLDIRIEQVRLVFIGMRSSLFLGLALALVLLLALDSAENRQRLLGWFALVVVTRVLCVGYAMLALRRGVTPGNASRLILGMSLIKVLEGLAWGSLAWVVMGHGSLMEQLLVMASLAGVSGNAVSLLAPVFPLYASMQFAQLVAINSKLWLIGDASYRNLAIGCSLYVAGQVGQALIAQRASRRSIALRFENLDLVERLQVESERAEAARDTAEQANLAKSKFLAAASHDLRQPAYAQELFLEVLARSELSDIQHKVLNRARAASQASAQMLNTLLDFSRIEAGVIEPQRRAFRLQPLFNKLENELGSLADAKDIVYRCRETQLAVDSDPALLELMLRNLIANAIRYTERGGLLVACRRRGDAVLIEVFDTGIGIEPSQQGDVFREFHQLGNPERDRLKGLGLGLAITEGLARSLGHGVSLVSRPGRGSVFRIRLPLAQGNFSDDVFEQPSAPQLQAKRLRGLRVLVIDDDASVRDGMLHLLEDWGCECRAVEDIEDALRQVEQWPVQVLISDYRLREHQTGAQAISQVREALGAAVPALIITGDTAPERLREARTSGVPLLHKPVSPAQLYRALVNSLDD